MSDAPSWNAGDELAERTLPPVDRMRLIKYAGASGDFNPIHLVDEAASEAGLPGVIAHGMLTVAAMGILFSPYLEYGYVKALRSRFSGMVFLGDVLRVGGRASGVEDTGGGRLYGFEVYACRGDDTVASGTAEFLVYDG